MTVALNSQRLEVRSLLALKTLPRVGNKRARMLFEQYFPQECADEADYQEAFLSVIANHCEGAFNGLTNWSKLTETMRASDEAGIIAIPISAGHYPIRLRDTGDAPAVLFVKGNLDALNTEKSVAIVGSREASRYAEKAARSCGQIAAELGTTVVSGLALGCDTWAHQGCLAGGGTGVAVMAHGLDIVYPAANRGLADRLVSSGGCLVSEYPLATKPNRWAFAYRDRIQSGLADGVLVVETPLADGTMHTVAYASKQLRAVACVVPGEGQLDSPLSAGNRRLLGENSTVGVTSSGDFSQFLGSLRTRTASAVEREAASQLSLEGIA